MSLAIHGMMGRCLTAFGMLLGSSQHPHHDNYNYNNNHHGNLTREAERDRIDRLPGLRDRPKFAQFSGYLDVAESRHVFYWFVESQGIPEKDPVVFWTNGGPGCSGLLGFGTEHGPFHMRRSGKLFENPYSWNKVANVLYVEQPAGVGFSYVHSISDLSTGDRQASRDNYRLIREFLARFPSFQTNPFYIASESYGGHYVPQLALEILRSDTDGLINFRGFMVGNPYVDPYTNAVAQYDAYYYHGLMAKPLYDSWKRSCNHPILFFTEQCQDDRWERFGNGINPYALDYPVCIHHNLKNKYATTKQQQRDDDEEEEEDLVPSKRAADDPNIQTTASEQVKALANFTANGSRGPPFLPREDEAGYYPCATEYLTEYLSDPSVQEAIHVHEAVRGRKWSPCFRGIHYSIIDNFAPTIPLFAELVDRGVRGEHSLNMLVYSGDDDAVCATSGTQNWIWSLGVDAEKDRQWRPWKVRDQTAGFVTRFDLGNVTDASFTFATVHGAGHEVPAYRPMEALRLFRNFLDGKW